MGKKKSTKKQARVCLAILAVAVIAAAVTAICVSCGNHGSGDTESGIRHRALVMDTRATDADTASLEADPLAGRSVYFSGIEDTTIYLDTVLQLDNREENRDFLMRYEVYDSDRNLVFETGLIPSGQHVDWVPGETLGAGEYTLDFLQIPYYVGESGEYTSLTQGSCQVALAILD